MSVFHIFNALTGYSADVYQREHDLYTVEVSDVSGDYTGGHSSDSLTDCINYALLYS